MYLNNFQSYIFGAVLLFVMGFVACEKSAENFPVFQMGNSAQIKKSETVWFESEPKLKLTVDEINDSRCPANVVCVRAGEAKVKITINDLDENLVKFTLNFGEASRFKPDTLDFNLNAKAYRVILSGVNPYPGTGGSPNNSKAEITLQLK
jgi:hypothetical protein